MPEEKIPLPPFSKGEKSKEFEQWDSEHKTHRLWARDATLWTGNDESNWMGWLSAADTMRPHAQSIIEFAKEVRDEGFKHVLLLGMGGSSLCPEVLRKTFGDIAGFPALRVLDSTDPAQIVHAEKNLDLAKTLFIVSSKSGGTLESNILLSYFYEKAVPSQFVAITDPGTKLEHLANEKNFRRVFHGEPSIGGRYSALSYFGLLPAALMGIDISRLLDAADAMAHACAPSVLAQENPGVSLGLALGSLANQKRNKLTILTSPKIGDLGTWLEQLVAESTGKQGLGIIPIDREPMAEVETYGYDRVFVFVRLEHDANEALDDFTMRLREAGQPVMVLSCQDFYGLGAEFFRWEIATAVASSVIGVNPFDQPDVEASKIETKRLMEQDTVLTPSFVMPHLMRHPGHSVLLQTTSLLWTPHQVRSDNVEEIRSLLASIQPHDYFNISAFIEMNDENDVLLREIRAFVSAKKRVATCHGFGPRFLHSTGQAYKGGPNTGVFLQINCDDAQDIQVPGTNITFGQVKKAQAQGDLAVLLERGRRVLHVHLSGDVNLGLRNLKATIEKVLE